MLTGEDSPCPGVVVGVVVVVVVGEEGDLGARAQVLLFSL